MNCPHCNNLLNSNNLLAYEECVPYKDDHYFYICYPDRFYLIRFEDNYKFICNKLYDQSFFIVISLKGKQETLLHLELETDLSLENISPSLDHYYNKYKNLQSFL